MANARIVSLSIDRDTPFAGGAPFGGTGAYRLIAGRAEIAIRPDAIGADGIYEAGLIETGADGLIRAETDVFILTPADAAKGNRTLVFEFINRGNKRALQFFNQGTPGNTPESLADAGNGWLMEAGYTLVVAAWQGDVLRGDGRMTIRVPGYSDDAPTRIAAEFIVEDEKTSFLPLSTKTGTRSYPAATLATSAARLTRRRYPDAPREKIASDAFAFERIDGDAAGLGGGDIMAAEQAIVPCARHIRLDGGFVPGWIYELEYDATGAIALDMGFVAVAEIVAFLRDETGDANPLSGALTHTIGWGRSQAGRAIRDFIWRGFNVASSGARVFDGMIPHISGGGKTNMNRFTNLVVAASRDHEDQLNPSDRFPFSYARSTDHLTGRDDAILKRPDTDPLVIHTHTASEYWYRRGSLVHTDTQGNDLEQPETVRIYTWASSQHWADTRAAKPVKGPCRELLNNVYTAPFFPATLRLMRDWIAEGIAPPPSRIPLRSDETLVDVESYRERFPELPGVILPTHANALPLVEYGDRFDDGGAITWPPQVDESRAYAVLVPAPDAMGNDTAGLKAPMVEAPLGTYTGWNLRGRGHGHGMLFSFMGSYIPLPEIPQEAELTGDPRPAITALYPSPEDYSSAIAASAERLVAEGFLEPDATALFTELARAYGRVNHIHRF
ncbi:alpha/beta hydrolase domain-containing protein [Tropicimonas sp. IMCC34011]|uniref:alpha/beta hydrolase domain-containing protein n=1 Tax=Tropicimonas sp. IMCC34011 TaxID=2248759 RepID=UPI000E262A22|nr:alpha/beta hydrolase domain-containing protein [Tropicimonas sp. IMCC34011]